LDPVATAPGSDTLSAYKRLASQHPCLPAKLIPSTEVNKVVAGYLYQTRLSVLPTGARLLQLEGDRFYRSRRATIREYRAEMFKYSGDDPTVPCIVEDGKYLQSGWGDRSVVERSMTDERSLVTKRESKIESDFESFRSRLVRLD